MRKSEKDVGVLRSGNTFKAYLKGDDTPFLEVSVLKKKENGMIKIEISPDYERISSVSESQLENMTGMVDRECNIVTLAIKNIVRDLFCDGEGVYARFNNKDKEDSHKRTFLGQYLKAAGFVASDTRLETIFFITRPL